MTNGKPAPRMDYGQFLKTQLEASAKHGPAMTKVQFRRTLDMMKSDPAYRDGNTYNYDAIQKDMWKYLPQDKMDYALASGDTLGHDISTDKAYQEQINKPSDEEGTEEQAQGEEELPALKALETQQKHGPTGLSKEQLKNLEEEHGKWVTLKSGKKVFIKNK